jgi:hypothetical protein
MVLAPYNIQFGNQLYCPLLVAQEGFSRSIKLPGATNFLNDTHPLFFPLGEHMAKTVTTTNGTLHRAFFLPEVCNISRTITYEDLYASVKSLKGGSAFLRVLQALESQLTPWLAAVQAKPDGFASPSILLL